MKIPRDWGGDDLIKLLRRFGYEPTRQSGSHVRLTTRRGGEHHLTIPRHKPLKIGTLRNILAEVAVHLNLTIDELLEPKDR